MRLALWSRLRLAPRIAIMIALTLAANVGLEIVLRTLIPPPVILFFERNWLIDTVGGAREAALAALPENRAEALRGLPASLGLTFSLAPLPVEAGGGATPFFDGLRHDIAFKLGLPLEDVVLTANSVSSMSRAVTPVVVLLDEMPSAISVDTNNDSQKPVFGDLRMSVRLAPDAWVIIRSSHDGRELERTVRNMLYPVGGLLLIGGLSLWVARGITRPLSDLAGAAERLGRERQPTLLGEFSVPELKAIAHSFNDMQLRLKQFVDDRLHMLAAISHDLRTPLTRLRLFAEYLEDSEQRRQILSDIHDMEEMVSSTLTFAGNQVQNEKKAAVDLAALLISVCDIAADAGFHVSYSGPDHAYLSCHPLAIRRAIVNLVDNACKYAHLATVTLTDTAESVVFVIADDGPGIPSDQVEQAFQPFVRLEGSRNRETGGAGLGLSITRDVIQMHGGSVVLAAAQPSGLMVTVTLPRQAG